jgi:peptide-methionine (R)-S-oxide reductase
LWRRDNQANPVQDASLFEGLTVGQRRVLLERGTEVPFSGEYVDHSEVGVYSCVACGTPLFGSDAKFDSITAGLVGWPAFSSALDETNVELREDRSLGMQRTEIVCKGCGGHLGHLFDDPGAPERTHYCVNSVCLQFKPQDASGQ